MIVTKRNPKPQAVEKQKKSMKSMIVEDIKSNQFKKIFPSKTYER